MPRQSDNANHSNRHHLNHHAYLHPRGEDGRSDHWEDRLAQHSYED